VSLVRSLLSRLLQRPSQEVTGLPEITLTPIGVAQNSVPVPQAYDFDWQRVESRIMVKPELADALLGLDGYSHVVVLFWPHQVPAEVRGSKHRLPLDDPQNPSGHTGHRSQIRFNPILVTAVRLLGVKGNVVKVRRLDAVNGSPVLDLKPYNPISTRSPTPNLLVAGRCCGATSKGPEDRGGH
jgi:tRNA (Thr-GGU) A37 N-methylase